MAHFLTYLPLILIFLGIIVTSFIIYYAEKRRSEELAAFASSIGWSFSRYGESLQLPKGLMSKGHSEDFSNVMQGSQERYNLKVFDFSYTVGYGKFKHTMAQTVLLCQTSTALPQFSLAAESFFHFFADPLGMRDIDFPANLDFSKKFLLKGTNEAQVRRLFNPDVLSHLQQASHLTCIEAEGDKIAVFIQKKRHKPEELRQFLSFCTGLFKKMGIAGQEEKAALYESGRPDALT